MKYPNIVRAVAEMPWAIRPSTLAVIIDILRYRSEGHQLSQDEINERIGAAAAARRSAAPAGQAGVAIIPIYGVLAPRAAIFAQTSSSGTGVDQLRQGFRQAMADPEVGAILLDIDSPGGQVDQIPELAAEIREARARKPIVAIANTDAASAAYWLGAQASELSVTPSGQVGSVGVFSVHEDISAHLEMEGVKPTLISEGKYKVEGNPFEALADDAKAEIQSKVREYYDMFVGDLARGRGTSAATVRKSYGEGRMLTASKAVEAGMADRVETFDQALRRTMRLAQRRGTDAVAIDSEGLGNGPYAEHGERVTAALQVFVERTEDRRTARAAADRDLSAGDRQRLVEMRMQLVSVTAAIDALLTDPGSAAEALAAEAVFLENEARLNGVAV